MIPHHFTMATDSSFHCKLLLEPLFLYVWMFLKEGSQCISVSFSVSREHSKVMTFIKSIMPSAKFVESVGTDLTVGLPHQGDYSASLHQFFENLDAQLGSLGVLSYGVSSTTLEEVFLKVTAAAFDFNVPLGC